MTTKTYTKRQNATRAAKAVLGKNAKAGDDFVIGGQPGAFTWKAKGKTKRAGKGKGRIQDQPKMRLLLAAIQAGVSTVAGLQAEMGKGTKNKKPVASHTVRGAVSRLRAEGVPITTGREFRLVHYKLAKGWHPTKVAGSTHAASGLKQAA